MFKRNSSETQQLQASLRGDAHAFGHLVSEYQSLVCAITYSATGNATQSEELAQEIFLKAWKNLSQLQDLSKFRPWLCRIARTTVKNWFRGRKRDTTGKAVPLEAAGGIFSKDPGPAETTIRREHEAMVNQALSQLPESQREALVLFYREQQSTAEVARQLDISDTAARQRISRARQTLRAKMLSVIEQTLTDTRPGTAFAVTVVAALGGLSAKTTVVAAVDAAAVGVTGIAAKLVLAAAGLGIIAGGWALSKRFNAPATPEPPSETRQTVVVDPIPNEVRVSPAARTPILEHAQASVFSVVDETHATDTSDSRQGTTSSEGSVPEEAFVFQPKGVLSGMVVDQDTGEPIAGALINISKRRRFKARTDSNGFYYFNEIHESGNFEIAIDVPAYIGIPVSFNNPLVQLNPDQQAVKHFELPRACQVALSVVDANGVGIEDAKVIATSLAGASNKVVAYFATTRKTDPNGFLLYGGFAPADAEYLITVFHQQHLTRIKDGRRWGYSRLDYAPAKALVRLTDPNRITPVTVILQKGEPVHGYVEYADGIPATDIEIVARPAWWHCNHTCDPYPVNSDGTFVLTHTTPGQYDICAKFPHIETGGGGSTMKILTTHLPLSSDEPLVVTLPDRSPQSLASISGGVLVHGSDIPRYVTIEAFDPVTRKRGRAEIWESRGQLPETFMIERLEPGTYTLTFSGEDIEEKVLKQVEAPSSDLFVELFYQKDPILTGQVTDYDTGQPITKFSVRARKLSTLRGPHYTQQDHWIDFGDEQGTFSLEVVGPGLYALQVSAEGYATAWSESASTDVAGPVHISLSRGGGLKGTVTNELGQPISGAQVIPLSLACGVGQGENTLFMTTLGAVETVDGRFTLKHLPPGTDTLKVVHPDYAFAFLDQIEIVENQTADVDIVLSSGGTVEGVVYDDEGQPHAKEIIHFLPAQHSNHDLSGRLVSVTTDANGYYCATHLPLQLLRVRRGDPYDANPGVHWQTVYPENGVVDELNFGGFPLVTGQVIMDGRPLKNNKLTLGSRGIAPYARFECTTQTDSQGHFVFSGIIPGAHTMYCQDPDKGMQLKIATIEMGTEDLDVGVISADVSRLFVTLITPGASWNVRQLYLTRELKGAVSPVSFGTAPPHIGEPWVLKNVSHGAYVLNLLSEGNLQWKTSIELEANCIRWDRKVTLPAATASISGRIVGPTPPQGLVLENGDQTLTAAILADAIGQYHLKNLPAGDYTVGTTLSMIYDLPTLTQFSLNDGEHLNLDTFDLTQTPPEKTAMILVQLLDQDDMPQGDADIELKGPLGSTSPNYVADNAYIIMSCPGHHQLYAEVPGFQPVSQSVDLKPTDPTSPAPQNILIHLQKAH